MPGAPSQAQQAQGAQEGRFRVDARQALRNTDFPTENNWAFLVIEEAQDDGTRAARLGSPYLPT